LDPIVNNPTPETSGTPTPVDLKKLKLKSGFSINLLKDKLTSGNFLREKL
jgi:hypothetical protein